jgi:hypothetical protein
MTVQIPRSVSAVPGARSAVAVPMAVMMLPRRMNFGGNPDEAGSPSTHASAPTPTLAAAQRNSNPAASRSARFQCLARCIRDAQSAAAAK